jgi:hypothetical protein
MACCVEPLLHAYVNGAMPVDDDTEAAPLGNAQVVAVEEIDKLGSDVVPRVADAVAVQPMASVIVRSYVPAGTLLKAAVVEPLLHAYA